MNVLGIIVEYNPFHFGHLYHLKQSQKLSKADYTIAVMSGQFTQRGEAAIVDKWIRAETAVACGVDLVLELPAVYAVQNAELFAYGGIQMLNHTGLTTHVCFGSETGEIAPLNTIADILVAEDPKYKALLKDYLAQGLSYPAARQQAILRYVGTNPKYDTQPTISKMLSGSNSILAIEYLKALKQTHSHIVPLTIPRIRSSYTDTTIKKGIASATSIRREILQFGMTKRVRQAMPEPVFRILNNAFDSNLGPVDNQALEGLILGLLRRSSISEISTWMDVSEGLENRIKEQALTATNLKDFLSLVKTRRYVHTRLQRILIHGLLNLSTINFWEMNVAGRGPRYLRILAFSKNAIPLLKRLKETAQVPILTKAAHISRHDSFSKRMFEYDSLATDLYSLAIPNPNMRHGGRDFTTTPSVYP